MDMTKSSPKKRTISKGASDSLKGIGKKTKERVKIRDSTEMIRQIRREDLEEL
jgi:hypothetical protein